MQLISSSRSNTRLRRLRVFTPRIVAPLALASVLAAGSYASHAQAQNRVVSTDLTNIAAAANGGRILSVTSTLDNDQAYEAKNLIDGKVWNATNNSGSKGWASDKFDPIAMDSITLGFGGNRLYHIGKIVLNPTTDLTPERWAKDIEVQVSTETADGPWTPVAQLTLSQRAEPQEFTMLPVQARFMRLVFRTNYGSDRAVALGEVQVYEAIDDSDPMGSVISRLDSTISELRKYRDDQNDSTPTTRTVNTSAPKTPAALGAAGKTNIAAAKNGGRIVMFSSYYNNDAQYGPDKLIDGDNFREADGKGSWGWSSQGFEPGKEYVTIGFAGNQTRLVNRFVLNPVSNQSNLRWARRIDVQATTGDPQNGPWKQVTTINLKPNAANQEFTVRSTEAKYVRFIFQANGPGVVLPNGDPNVNSDRSVSLGEIEIYEPASSDDQLDAMIGHLSQVSIDLKKLRRDQLNAGVPTDDMATPASVPAPAQVPAPAVVPVQAQDKPTVQTPVAKPQTVKPKVTPIQSKLTPASRISPPKPVKEAENTASKTKKKAG